MRMFKKPTPLVAATVSFAGEVALAAGLQMAHQHIQAAISAVAHRVGLRRHLASPLGQVVLAIGPTAALYAVARWVPMPGRIAAHRTTIASSCRAALV